MTTDPFASDCSQCAALCCIAFAFDEGEFFAHSKPVGVACKNLAADGCCRIHDGLAAQGYAGCVNYRCLGAGQATVQQVFGGRSWQEQADLGPAMIEAFRRMRGVRDMASQLAAAEALPVSDEMHDRRAAFYARLMPEPGWTAEAFAAFDLPAARKEFGAMLDDLRDDLASRIGSRQAATAGGHR